jgi:hypothetical protein
MLRLVSTPSKRLHNFGVQGESIPPQWFRKRGTGFAF